ncbi:hypothetical protein FQN50_002041 [Emmonsiellopsis sp. PD_5]|nr:hypothetical protein FQN50_002041 [Emmonsiellopsis sp. PD_5]
MDGPPPPYYDPASGPGKAEVDDTSVSVALVNPLHHGHDHEHEHNKNNKAKKKLALDPDLTEYSHPRRVLVSIVDDDDSRATLHLWHGSTDQKRGEFSNNSLFLPTSLGLEDLGYIHGFTDLEKEFYLDGYVLLPGGGGEGGAATGNEQEEQEKVDGKRVHAYLSSLLAASSLVGVPGHSQSHSQLEAEDPSDPSVDSDSTMISTILNNLPPTNSQTQGQASRHPKIHLYTILIFTTNNNDDNNNSLSTAPGPPIYIYKWTKPSSIYPRTSGFWETDVARVVEHGSWNAGRELRLLVRRVDGDKWAEIGECGTERVAVFKDGGEWYKVVE